MGRPGNRCVRCSGPMRGRSGRRGDIVQHCATCGHGVCVRHVTWDSACDAWVCSKCARDAGRRPREEADDGR